MEHVNQVPLRMDEYPRIELRGYKWPHRLTGAGRHRLLGEDEHGLWLGVPQGEPWQSPDGSRSGVYEQTLVKLVPKETFWTACFQTIEPVVDVDIVVPVTRVGQALEEIDLELDVLRTSDGTVSVRDQDEFERVRREWHMPPDIAQKAKLACEHVSRLLERNAEPFATVGPARLARFLVEMRKTTRAANFEDSASRELPVIAMTGVAVGAGGEIEMPVELSR